MGRRGYIREAALRQKRYFVMLHVGGEQGRGLRGGSLGKGRIVSPLPNTS